MDETHVCTQTCGVCVHVGKCLRLLKLDKMFLEKGSKTITKVGWEFMRINARTQW